MSNEWNWAEQLVSPPASTHSTGLANVAQPFSQDAAGLAGLLSMTGKMRLSTPMSPRCIWFGLPPRAMTAQFLNSNGGIGRAGSPLPAASC